MKKALLIALSVSALASCSTSDSAEGTWSGKYKLEAGQGVFYPEGTNEKWLVVSGISSQNFKTEFGKSVCFKNVIFEGRVSDPDDFGADATYKRSLAINTIVKKTRVDCSNF